MEKLRLNCGPMPAIEVHHPVHSQAWTYPQLSNCIILLKLFGKVKFGGVHNA